MQNLISKLMGRNASYSNRRGWYRRIKYPIHQFIPLGGSLCIGFVLMVSTGCTAGGKTGFRDQRAEVAHYFAPTPIPSDFNAQQAHMVLADIPDDPPAPIKVEPEKVTELPPKAQRRFNEARRLFSEQRYTETISELENVLRYDAGNHEAHRMMAQACMLSGSENRARLSAERALAINPADLTCHYILGRLLDRDEKTDQALRQYRMALKCPADSGSKIYRTLTHYYLGTLLEQDGYYAAALEQLIAFEQNLQQLGDNALENPELSTIIQLNGKLIALRIAKVHAILGRYGPAADALKTAYEQSGKDPALRGEYIRMLVRAGRINEAAEEARRFCRESEDKAPAVELLLAVYIFAGQPQQGLDVVEEIIAEQPGDVKLNLLYVDALFSVHQYEKAWNVLNGVMVRFPNAPEVSWKLIKLERVRQNWSSWLRSLAQTLAQRPNDYSLANEELQHLPADKAQVIVSELLVLGQDDRTYLPADLSDNHLASALDYLGGRLCDRLDRIEDAQKLFERSLQLRAGFLPATIGVADMYVQRCRWHDALDIIEGTAQVLDQPVYQIERLLGQCYEGLDDFKQAVEHFEKALQLNQSDVQTMMLLGRLYERFDMLRNAQLQYQSVLGVDSANVEAREALIRNLWAQRQDQPSIIRRVVSELMELKRLAPNSPSSIRCAAMLEYLVPQNPDIQAYAKVLRMLIKEHPDDLRSREDLAATLYAGQEYGAARTELQEILNRQPCSPTANYLMVQVLIRLLEYDQAEEQFKRMIAWYPNRQAWINSLGEFQLIIQDYDGAIETWKRLLSFEEIAKDFKNQATIRIRLIQTYQEAGRYEEAEQALKSWLDDTDLKSRGMIHLLRSMLLSVDAGAENYTRYIERCRSWLDQDPDNHDIRNWLLAGLLGDKQFNEAILLTLEWLSENPDEFGILDWVVSTLQAAKQHDEAIEIARNQLSATTGPKDRYDRLKLLMDTYMKAEQYDHAITIHKKLYSAVSKMTGQALSDNEHFELDNSLSELYLRAGRFKDALATMKKSFDLIEQRQQRVEELKGKSKDDRYKLQLQVEEQKIIERKAQIFRRMSVAYQKQDRLDLAEDRLREAYELVPKDVGINNDLGYTLAELNKDLDTAEGMVRMAVSLEPRQAAYLDSLGWVKYKQGQWSKALTWLSRAARLESGQDVVIYDHLGDIQWRLEQKGEALTSWRKALEIYENQLETGKISPDKKLLDRIRNKIERAGQGHEPQVAPIMGEGDL